MGVLDFIKSGLSSFKFLKWIQIIQDETKATNPTAMYLLETSDDNFDIVVVDDAGNKRKNVSANPNSLISSIQNASPTELAQIKTLLGI